MACRQVIVVGAGPVGLSLALGLARRGRDVLVLEKNETIAEHSRAPAIWPRTQEVLAGLGMVDSLLREGIVLPRLEILDVDHDSYLLRAPLEELAAETRYPHLLILPQSRTEKLLLHALEQEPTAEVRFSCEASRIMQHPSKVEVHFRHAGADSSVDAEFVAGCDGAHSTVRNAIGATQEGITYGMRAALADIRIDGSSSLHSPRLTTQPRIAIGIRMAEDLWRIILPFRKETGVSLDRKVDEAAIGLFNKRAWKPVWQSEFSLHRRISSSFAEGRIVLAGDAAHLNSPVGGQGMNAGIQDTELLTRALVVALDQGRNDALLDYGRERRQKIRKGVNRFTDILTRVLLMGQGRMIRAIFRLANQAMRAAPIRRRILRRLAMLD